jgi:hypothetical protein
MEAEYKDSKEEGVCSGDSIPGSATLYFMPCINFGCPKMHPPRIYCLLVFGSVVGVASQAAATGITSHAME